MHTTQRIKVLWEAGEFEFDMPCGIQLFLIVFCCFFILLNRLTTLFRILRRKLHQFYHDTVFVRSLTCPVGSNYF
eukprot:gene10953-7603_t